MPQTFTSGNFHAICDELAERDHALKRIVKTHGYPPMWTRRNTFESLVHIILEQQVSLASALAALNKLRERLPKFTPAALLALTDAELRVCYFSRQKTVYARALAEAIQSRQFSLKAMEKLSDNDVREQMITLKGIGHWTIDVYLMFVLRRADVFPVGDLAAVNALKKIKKLPKETPHEKLLKVSVRWKPYRTVATMILWHYYLSLRVKDKSPETGKIRKVVTL